MAGTFWASEHASREVLMHRVLPHNVEAGKGRKTGMMLDHSLTGGASAFLRKMLAGCTHKSSLKCYSG